MDSDLFDENLAARVRDYQRDRRLPVDGMAGHATQVAISSDLGGGDMPRLAQAELGHGSAPNGRHRQQRHMSFILDALRKSDAERQRAVTPGLSDVRYAARQLAAQHLAAHPGGRARRQRGVPRRAVARAGRGTGGATAGRDPGRGSGGPPAAAPPEAAARDIRPLAREAEFGEPLLEPDLESEFAAPPGAGRRAGARMLEAAEAADATDHRRCRRRRPSGTAPAAPQPATPVAHPGRQ